MNYNYLMMDLNMSYIKNYMLHKYYSLLRHR